MLFHHLEDENHKQHDLHHQTGNLQWLALYKSMLDICDMYLESILPDKAAHHCKRTLLHNVVGQVQATLLTKKLSQIGKLKLGS
jgi:hypothetical protein